MRDRRREAIERRKFDRCQACQAGKPFPCSWNKVCPACAVEWRKKYFRDYRRAILSALHSKFAARGKRKESHDAR